MIGHKKGKNTIEIRLYIHAKEMIQLSSGKLIKSMVQFNLNTSKATVVENRKSQ